MVQVTAIAATSPNYRHLDKGFLRQWGRYCPGVPVEIFETEQNDWAGSLHRKVQTIQEPAVVLVMSDYFMMGPADEERLRVAHDLVVGGSCEKCDLTTQVRYWDHVACDGMVEATQTAQYRQSTQAAVWSTQYLLQCLAHGGTPWQWELGGWSINDGARIRGFRTPVMNYADVMLKGQAHGFMLCKLVDQDLEELDRIGALEGLMDVRTIKKHRSA